MDTARVDEFGAPIGYPVSGWQPRPELEPVTLTGRTCTLEPVADHHIEVLHRELNSESRASLWTYYPAGPHAKAAELAAWLEAINGLAHVVITPDGRPRGVASYMRLDAANGSVEVGNIVFGDSLGRTTAATEAIFLMLSHAFDDLGYRRFEWKCDSLNARSRAAAARFGFTYEGTFRNAVVYRGRNRDTAWFSIIDSEWPTRRAEYERWLEPSNFDSDGRQLTRLQRQQQPTGSVA